MCIPRLKFRLLYKGEVYNENSDNINIMIDNVNDIWVDNDPLLIKVWIKTDYKGLISYNKEEWTNIEDLDDDEFETLVMMLLVHRREYTARYMTLEDEECLGRFDMVWKPKELQSRKERLNNALCNDYLVSGRDYHNYEITFHNYPPPGCKWATAPIPDYVKYPFEKEARKVDKTKYRTPIPYPKNY